MIAEQGWQHKCTCLCLFLLWTGGFWVPPEPCYQQLAAIKLLSTNCCQLIAASKLLSANCCQQIAVSKLLSANCCQQIA